jgi:hypothetical protein
MYDKLKLKHRRHNYAEFFDFLFYSMLISLMTFQEPIKLLKIRFGIIRSSTKENENG